MHEWKSGDPPQMVDAATEKDSGAEPNDLGGDAEFFRNYFAQCEENRDLLTKIRVVVPVRPQDGMAIRLAQMATIWYGEGTGWNPLNDHMGGYIDVTRANIAYDFLKNARENYVLMIDNDQEPPVNLPYLLARHNKPVVGSVIMANMSEGPSACFSIKDTNGDYRFPTIRSGQKIPHSGLVEVGHVGTGALLIRRDVLESFTFGLVCAKCRHVVKWDQLEHKGTLGELFRLCDHEPCGPNHMYEDIPFFVPLSARIRGMARGALEVGEDIAFCNQIRAKGYSMYVDLEAHVGHRKTVSLQWDPEMTDTTLDPKDWVLPTDGKQINTS